MDIERLTKAQIILLTLLVSFVTSIATGIVTVTLLEQAPPVVTQTINRIVEHTVERVVPGNTQPASVVTTEKTVVVNEEDLVTQAIEKNADKIVKIFRKTAEGPVFVALGAILSKDGVVVVATDRTILSLGGPFEVVLSNGKEIAGEVVGKESDSPVLLLRLSFKEEDGVVPGSIKYGDINALKLGQSVLTLYGKDRTSVAVGIISGLDEEESELPQTADEKKEGKAPTVVSVLEVIETTLPALQIERGGVLLNIFGDVIGMSTSKSRFHGGQYFTPIQVAQSQLAELVSSETKSTQP